MELPTGPFCQSCGMPMETEQDFGTDADGNLCRDYCCFCFKNGEFTDPDMTLERMTSRVAEMMAQETEMTVAQARGFAQSVLPGLRRWRH